MWDGMGGSVWSGRHRGKAARRRQFVVFRLWGICASRRVPFPLVVALLLSAGCGGSARPASDGRTVRADSLAVAGVVRERLAAALRGDTATWHRFVADDAVWTGPALALATTRDVLVSIAANRQLQSGEQSLDALTVFVKGDIAHASYVQVVESANGAAFKRFRKTDTYQRSGNGWLLVAAAEIAIADRVHVSVSAAQVGALAGSYMLGETDTLVIAPVGRDRLLLTGGGATPDTLLPENDSVFFQDGDRGSWVFERGRDGVIARLLYRASGQDDVVLRRVAAGITPGR